MHTRKPARNMMEDPLRCTISSWSDNWTWSHTEYTGYFHFECHSTNWHVAEPTS